MTKRKNQKDPYDREPIYDRHEHTIASSAYRHAKQRAFFLSGEDVLRSLDTEMNVGNAPSAVSYRHGVR